MASYNLRNTIPQGIQIGYYTGGVLRSYTIGAGESHAFEADLLTPETETAVARRFLVPVTGTEIQPAGTPGTTVPGFGLQFRYFWDASLLYYPGDLVTHGDYVWLAHAVSAAVVPGDDASVWTVFGAPGVGTLPAVQDLADRVAALEGGGNGRLPVYFDQGDGNPVFADVPPGRLLLWRNTAANRLRFYINQGGAVHRSPEWSLYIEGATIDDNTVTIDTNSLTIDTN